MLYIPEIEPADLLPLEDDVTAARGRYQLRLDSARKLLR